MFTRPQPEAGRESPPLPASRAVAGGAFILLLPLIAIAGAVTACAALWAAIALSEVFG
jgi:hypothetical protein